MENQFETGEYIVYDTYGICKIKEIKRMSLMKEKQSLKSRAKTYRQLMTEFFLPAKN